MELLDIYDPNLKESVEDWSQILVIIDPRSKNLDLIIKHQV